MAELLAKLVESETTVPLREEELKDIRTGVQGLPKLRSDVSNRWSRPPTVLEETRRSRGHETG